MKTIIALASVVIATSAFAQEGEVQSDAPKSSDGIGLEIALKAGGHFPQLVNPLSTTFDGILKVGYSPLANKQIQFLVEGSYSQPSMTFSSNDPRLGEEGRDFQSTLTIQDLGVLLGAQYYFSPLSSVWVPYVGAGVQAHFLAMNVEAAGGGDFGAHRETNTRFGGAVFGGTGFHLGPGLLLGEVRFGYAPVEEVVTGVSNIGHLSVLLGYGILL